MNIIGLSIVNHDDSLCLIKDGELKTHFQLERYTRYKKNLLEKYVNNNKIRIIDNVKFKKSFLHFNECFSKSMPADLYAFSICGRTADRELFFMKNKIIPNGAFDFLVDVILQKQHVKNLNEYNLFFNNKCYIIDHHQAHAAYALYTSKFKESDILAHDGSGFLYTSIFVDKDGTLFNTGMDSKALARHYKQNEIQNIEKISSDLFIGILWAFFSALCYNDSYKVGTGMAIAAYGKINDKLLKFIYDYKEFSGTLRFNDYLKYKYNHAIDLLKYCFNLKSRSELNETIIADIFATLQYFSTELVVNNIKKYKTSDNLCISGGCALNGYINEELLKRKIYKKIHVPPAASDEGLSIGCALHAYYNLEGKRINFNDTKKIMYLGEKHKIEKFSPNCKTMKDDDLIPYIAKKISEGNVVGWYQGKSESGPRALGNRSLLADPRNPKMKDHINSFVKKREWYRPFAPSILLEDVSKWFITNGSNESPFMTRIMKYKKGKSTKVPAVTHVDDTARLQTVTEEINPRFYKLIKEFKNITNVPILLNTSFNTNEPMVETSEDAFKTFILNKIDILVIENDVYIKDNDENRIPYIDRINENE